MTTLGLAFLAGVLSTLSPCVLPLLPIVIAASATQHRWGPIALAAGLSLAFVAIGLFVAVAGFSIGLDQTVFRAVAATLLVTVGAVLLLPQLQLRIATATGPVSGWAQSRIDGLNGAGIGSQFALGFLLGAVWTPCVGPTLGAASVLAARAENLLGVAVTMGVFGIGAALPLVAIGLMSRATLARWRSRMLAAGSGGKTVMGGILVLVGILVLTGFDKRLEAVLVDLSPAWLTALTTRF
jgi:cytochrome c biogenesis protein CcdA